MPRLDIRAQSGPALDVTKKAPWPELKRFWAGVMRYWLKIIRLRPGLYDNQK